MAQQYLPDRADEPADSTRKKRIEIINTDVFEFVTTDTTTIRLFKGNVHFRHEGTDFHCRKANQFLSVDVVIAEQDVHIQKVDSFDIWADHLVYYSRKRLAEFRGNVVFRDSTARMLTDSLDYDLRTDIGKFWGGGTLENDSSILSSRTGTYYHRRREAVFQGDVHLKNPEFDLYSDSMRYDTRSKVAWFIAPTKIVNGDDVIYCESGFYDTKTNRAEFGGNTKMTSGATKISADHLVYDKVAGYGEARGNVIWEDTVEQITILAQYADYKDSLDYVLATEDPLLIDITDGDTLYMSADTLITFRMPVERVLRNHTAGAITEADEPVPTDTLIADSLSPVPIPANDSASILPGDTVFVPPSDPAGLFDTTDIADALSELQPDSNVADSVRTFIAYRNTRLLSGRMSGVCDSLYFNQSDSTFRMHDGPMMWVDTTQFSGDSMHMVMKNKALDKVIIFRNAIIVHENEPGVYDQTKGKLITGYFEGDYMDRIVIDGNGESIYFIQDDSMAFVGGNKSLCARMIVYMQDSSNNVDRITFLTKPEAVFTPFSQIDLNTYSLDGIRWQFERKPKNVKDVVRYWPLYEYYLLRKALPDTAPVEEEVMPTDGISEEGETIPVALPVD